MLNTLPNLLTVSRIVAIPLLVAAFALLPRDWADWTAFALFAGAGITDWFDGFLARRWSVTSSFGAFLDPVADKLLVAAAIILLVWADRAPLLPALIILCRELLVSGLREFLAGIRISVPVSRLAKWKTAVQIGALCFLLIGPSGPALLVAEATPLAIGTVLIWIAAILTLITGYDYLRVGMRHMIERDGGGPPRDAEGSKGRDKTSAAAKTWTRAS